VSNRKIQKFSENLLSDEFGPTLAHSGEVVVERVRDDVRALAAL
jgi:hypothetical protein